MSTVCEKSGTVQVKFYIDPLQAMGKVDVKINERRTKLALFDFCHAASFDEGGVEER